MKKQTKIISVIAAVVVLVAVMAGLYMKFGPKTQEGAKTVTIEVVNDKGELKEYKINTDAEHLTEALKDAEKEGLTFSGTTDELGLIIDTVNGLKADYNENAAYWSFYVNGEYANYGPDDQPVADGDMFKIEYSVWEE